MMRQRNRIEQKECRSRNHFPVITLVIFLISLVIPASGRALAKRPGKKIDEENITNAIQFALALDDSVPHHLLDVKTGSGGIVTLSGSVDNVLAARRAVEIAKSVKGVVSVIDRISINTPARSDGELLKDVKAALAWDMAIESYEIEPEVNKGEVILRGKVQSWQERKIAQYVASGVRGVTGVDNRIKLAVSEQRPDYDIKYDIERRLDIDIYVDEALVVVEVKNGKVTLSGVAGSAAEKGRAIADSWVSGVSSVDASDLDVQWWARDRMRRKSPGKRLRDSDVGKAVRDALEFDPRVDASDLGVGVMDGVATITGEVCCLDARKAAEQTAMNTVGVLSVWNLLNVRPKKRVTDSEIKDRVRAALKRDPYLSAHPVYIVVKNAKVHLYGKVDTQYERSHAAHIVSGVKGVVAVHNGLKPDDRYWDNADDWNLMKKIESLLTWSPAVDEDEIKVSVEGGLVTLSGSVDTLLEKREAGEKANEAGARTINNRLEIKNIGE